MRSPFHHTPSPHGVSAALDLTERFRQIALKLVDQQAAEILVAPQRSSPGHWFGGGNMVRDANGTLWLVGRYRNQGDSRTGLGAGERGLELAIFRSDDGGNHFEKFESWSKADLNVGQLEVLSIEGSAIRITPQGPELYISSEKSGISYPPGLESFLKPGTGVWTIDRIAVSSFEQFKNEPIETVLQTQDPRYIHMKDPFLGSHLGSECLMFCTHPYCWTSSNTGFVSLENRRESLQKQIGELETQIREAASELATSQAKVQALRSSLDKLARNAVVVELAKSHDLTLHKFREGGPWAAHDDHGDEGAGSPQSQF